MTTTMMIVANYRLASMIGSGTLKSFLQASLSVSDLASNYFLLQKMKMMTWSPKMMIKVTMSLTRSTKMMNPHAYRTQWIFLHAFFLFL